MHCLIRKAAILVQEDQSGEILEASGNGVWSLFIGSRLFGKHFEAVKVIVVTCAV